MSSLALIEESEWRVMKEQAKLFVNSRLVSSRFQTEEQALFIMAKGRELGIPIIEALQKLFVTPEGQLGMAAETMLALIIKKVPKARFRYASLDIFTCSVAASRPCWDESTFTWTMQDAERAELLRKNAWRKYPRAMLRSRAIAEMARSMFPDAIGGISYTPEELAQDISIDDEGNVLDIVYSSEAEQRKPALIKESTSPLDRVFCDSSAWWAWLQKKMDEFNVAQDTRIEIERDAIGKTAGEILENLSTLNEANGR